MTEVPEHLLRRSKERRATLGGGDGGSEPPATPGEAPGTGAAASAVEPAGGGAVAPAAAAPAPVEEPPKPLPPYVAAAVRRPRIPKYAIPVLAALPLWALVYAGTLVKPASALDPELEQGQKVYAASCAGCHGATGQGGTGRPLGQVLQTFPDKADHLRWIMNGSPAPGTPYGDPKRPGGQRISGSDGYTTRMPGFKGSLSPEEIAAVARYEREVIGGGEAQPSTEEDLNPQASGSGTQQRGESEPGNSDTGSATSNAENQGGDVGGNNPEGGGSSAQPSTQGNDSSQTPTTTAQSSKGGGGTGAATGGDTTSSTGG